MLTPSSIKGDIKTFLKRHQAKELVRLLTCGSVDDGKSTLIGRLFLDASIVASDILEALERDSATHGTVAEGLDPALLTDGLKAEREQGITIDVSYRYFSTEKRTFIIADTPGHEQYTRNMATGASNSDLAIVLLDARNGVVEQTKRHSFIISLLGIKHVVVAVNKMDLVDFSEEVYQQIQNDYSEFAAKLEINDVTFVPISALMGDNVVEPSENMPWYTGGTFMHILNTVHIASDRNLVDFRLPIQYVNRPTSDYRGFCGTIASGVVRPGDEVEVLPARVRTKVKTIDTFGGSLDSAFTPMAVTITLEDEVDVSRGDMLVPPGNLTHVGKRLEATVVWMAQEALIPGTEYIIQHGTKSTRGTFESIRYEIDVNTLHRKNDVSELKLNSIGRCVLQTTELLTFDSYRRNRHTGSFIIIDRMTNTTVGAGMILERLTDEEMQKAIPKDVERTFPIFWLTGNTGAGKSTIAFQARDYINELLEMRSPLARRAIVLDGDEMRETISEQESLSAEDRKRHNLRVARLAGLLKKQGYLVIVSVIAPFAEVRQEIDELCQPKWIYVKREGLQADDKPYEPPSKPDFMVDNDALSIEQASEQVLQFIREQAEQDLN